MRVKVRPVPGRELVRNLETMQDITEDTEVPLSHYILAHIKLGNLEEVLDPIHVTVRVISSKLL